VIKVANKIDVWCQGVERMGNSLIFTLEIDDLPNIEEAEKLVETRLQAGNKVNCWDVAGIMFYINRQNKLIEQGVK